MGWMDVAFESRRRRSSARLVADSSPNSIGSEIQICEAMKRMLRPRARNQSNPKTWTRTIYNPGVTKGWCLVPSSEWMFWAPRLPPSSAPRHATPGRLIRTQPQMIQFSMDGLRHVVRHVVRPEPPRPARGSIDVICYFFKGRCTFDGAGV